VSSETPKHIICPAVEWPGCGQFGVGQHCVETYSGAKTFG
jgi:hypothetical protein